MNQMPQWVVSPEGNRDRVIAALANMTEKVSDLNEVLLAHEKLYGSPSADSPENVLLLTTAKSIPPILEAIGVIGAVLALELNRSQPD